MTTPWSLVPRHLRAHWVRTGLTATAMMVAVFLLCFLISIVTALESAVEQADDRRLVTQSSVSLFVELPLDYHPKIAAVPGIEHVIKFQWFGGYHRSPEDWFAQFAVDHVDFFEMYDREMRLVEGPLGRVGEPAGGGGDGGTNGDVAAAGLAGGGDAVGDVLTEEAVAASILEAMAGNRRGTVIGQGLAREFGWAVGDRVPLTSLFYTRTDGAAWEFDVVGIYEPKSANWDDRTMFFHWEYLEETLEQVGDFPATGVGTYSLQVAEGHDPAVVSAAVDGLFANGPQRTWTVTEAAFQATFVAMLGNVPLFVSTIGGAVAFAIFFSVVNTMLMAARQRSSEVGILKALGFSDGAVARLMVAESVLLSLLGGGLGVTISLSTSEGFRQMLGKWFPTYAVLPETAVLALGVSLLIGLVAGIGPAVILSRLKVTDALRSDG